MKIYKYAQVAFIFLLVSVTVTSCATKNNTQQQEYSKSEATPQSMQYTERASQLAPLPVETTSIKTANKNTLIASFSTRLLDKDPDRLNNIGIAADEISDYTVQPNEVFSFNGVVGKRLAAKGYEKARIIVNGEGKEGYGGGICQLSSTLFNAVDKSGLEVIERHSHSKDVHYVPKGRDAAINYKTQDFKFKNTKSYPIVIKASVDKKKVYVSIYKTM
jgi:Uncharacterized vancomycin resistance protein